MGQPELEPGLRTSIGIEADLGAMKRLGKSGPRVALAKSTPGKLPSAVWLTLPLSRAVAVSWSEQYGVYAARVPSRAGEPIVPIAVLDPVDDRTVVPFLGDTFGPTVRERSVPERHFGIHNLAAFPAAFGLIQMAVIRARRFAAPLNIVVLPAGFTADFTTEADLHFWIEPRVTAGIAPATIPSDALRIRLDRDRVAKTYRYGDMATLTLRGVPGGAE